APASRREHGERTDYRLADEILGETGAAYRVVARLALAEAVYGGEEVAGRELGRRGLALHELLAERLLLRRSERRRGRRGVDQGRLDLSGRQELLPSRGGRQRAAEIPRKKASAHLGVHGDTAEPRLLRLDR